MQQLFLFSLCSDSAVRADCIPVGVKLITQTEYNKYLQQTPSHWDNLQHKIKPLATVKEYDYITALRSKHQY